MDLMTVKEVAKYWNITTRRAAFLCANGKVEGARKLGTVWVIPEGTLKPVDGRTKKAKSDKR